MSNTSSVSIELPGVGTPELPKIDTAEAVRSGVVEASAEGPARRSAGAPTDRAGKSETGSQDSGGLGSAQGIRWLLLVGALVVGVSVVRLVAAQWPLLPTVVQFLTLCGGALAVHGLADVTRHRLRLPVAGAALYFLFAAMVPLLAWGAARLELLATPVGWVGLVLGLGALIWASRRTLAATLGYRGGLYLLALGSLLAALPVAEHFEAFAVGRGLNIDIVLFLAAFGLGFVLRAGSRHINRFFFHRDRLEGLDRPVGVLPFAVLALTYGATMALLAPSWATLAVPLAILALALVDTGEEYYRALVEASRRAEGAAAGSVALPMRWPRRSKGLLAVGFALLACAASLAAFDPSGRSFALATALAAWTLTRWAWRYRSTVGVGFGLAAGLFAYHAMPALVPDFVRAAFRELLATIGIPAGSPAALGVADLVPLAALLGLGLLARRKALGPAVERVHTVFASLQGLVLCAALAFEPAAALSVAPVAALILAGAWLLSRQLALVPALVHAVATTVAAFEIGMMDAPVTWILGLGGAHVLGLLAMLCLDRGHQPSGEAWLSTGGDVLALWVPFQALVMACLLVSSGQIGWAFLAAAVAARLLFAELRRRGRPDLGRLCAPTGGLFAASAGVVAVQATSELASGAPWWPVLPGFLASLYFVDVAVRGRERVLAALAAAGFFVASSWALFHHLSYLGSELYWLAPGIALLGLSKLLEHRLGEVGSKWMFTAGAFCLYAMPTMGLLDTLSWGWQSLLALFAVGFGAASFHLKSRSLLVLSTAALGVDLACFVLKLHQTAPMLLWVAGVAFGLGLMGAAAYLEHRRELVAQHVRVWRRELGAWA